MSIIFSFLYSLRPFLSHSHNSIDRIYLELSLPNRCLKSLSKYMKSLCVSPYYLILSFNVALTHSPPGQNCRHLADDRSNYIFMNKNVCILIRISLKFVPKGPIDNKPALVQAMAWRRIGDLNQCLSNSLTHICGTRGGWVKRAHISLIPHSSMLCDINHIYNFSVSLLANVTLFSI